MRTSKTTGRAGRRRGTRLAVAGLLAAATAGCSGAAGPAAPAAPAGPAAPAAPGGPVLPAAPTPTAASAFDLPTHHVTGALHWIIGGATLDQLRAADPGGALTKQFFDTPNAYVMTNNGSVPRGWSSTPTASFTSYATMQRVIAAGNLDPRSRAVLYDNERWSLTPAGEQADPVRYDQLAAQLAHRHHLLFVATPGVTLARTPPGQDRYTAFLASGLLASIARVADVIDLQAQGAETDPAAYHAFVAAAAAQARQSNPAVVVLAGISTSSEGAGVPASALVAAIRSVRSTVDGFWLNDPARSEYCPACVGPFPRVALAALAAIAHDPGAGG